MEMADDSFHMSAPTSPRRTSLEVGGLCFFSVPTSPTKTALNPAYQEPSSNGDDFEFETSRRFLVGERVAAVSQPEESLPAMAFADELFLDGKVMPLKPPPGLQHHHKQSSILSSPRSSSGGLRLSFQRRSLWNDDFDPFMEALKNVKEEQAKNHRRARSMSPSGIRIAVRYRSNKTIESKEDVKKSQAKVAEPQGVDSTMKPAKGQKIKKLWFRGGSISNGNGTESMTTSKRNFSLKAMGITQYKEEKTLTTLIQYRPKLLLCMGFGAKFVK